jgi:hypothetical protein
LGEEEEIIIINARARPTEARLSRFVVPYILVQTALLKALKSNP